MASSKPKTFNMRNFIKTENGRLSSLTLPRDLSLGGNKQKKIYKPNLNVIRNKNKPKEVVMREQHQKRNTRSAQPNRSFQGHQPKYVQSQGVFSEGTAEIKRPKINSDRYLSYKEQDAFCMTVPKVVQNNWDVDIKEETSVINDLLGDDSSSDNENEGEFNPVVLPLNSNKDENFLAIKKESDEKVDVKLMNGFPPVPMGLKNSKLYSDEHPCISLVRMPDSLPGKGYAEDSDKPIDYNLSQMNEGKIGKVLIRRSGNVEVYIGKTMYILDAVDLSLFKETLMSISDKSVEKPDIVDLGDIDEKYILSPSWKNLYQLKNNKLN